MNQFIPIPKALEILKKGSMLIVVDSPDRENQGDLIFPAETATDGKVNFLLRECRGMICVAITREAASRFSLPLMVLQTDNTETTRVQFTVTVDAATVTSFGISASDRATTIRMLANASAKSADFVRPGHVFPLLARDGGILERPGHTEAAAELCKRAGFFPSGVLCEILQEDGEVARLSKLVQFGKKHAIPIVSINDLIDYAKKHPLLKPAYQTVLPVAKATLPTEYGTFQLTVYRDTFDGREHLALSMKKKEPVLTRIHSQCMTGDIFHSLKCDCHAQLHESLRLIGKKKEGVLIYLNQEGRGIGLTNKIRAYALQEKGFDTVEANHQLGFASDERSYRVGADILKHLGISSIRLLTNNPDKTSQLIRHGITIKEVLPLEIPPHQLNYDYLRVKKQKLGHTLNISE